MVWKGTTKVGFGVATARGKKLVVARYSPPGNVPGRYNENVDLGNGGGSKFLQKCFIFVSQSFCYRGVQSL